MQVKIQDCLKTSNSFSIKWEKMFLFKEIFQVNSHFLHPKCRSFQEKLPSLIPRHLTLTWSNTLKMTWLIFLFATTYAILICKDTILELTHPYFRVKTPFVPFPAADFHLSIYFSGIQLIHMQSKKSLPPLNVAFAAAVTSINFHYFLSYFFLISFNILPTSFIDLGTLQQVYFEIVNK